MAKRKIIHTMETVKTSVDEKNWEDGLTTDLTIDTLVQPEGETAYVTFSGGSKYSYYEISELLKTMDMVEDGLSGV